MCPYYVWGKGSGEVFYKWDFYSSFDVLLWINVKYVKIMDIYEILNYPDYSRQFSNLEIEYDNFFVLVTGYIK
jgi:hypothetical protein